jgi:hypothetical protein
MTPSEAASVRVQSPAPGTPSLPPGPCTCASSQAGILPLVRPHLEAVQLWFWINTDKMALLNGLQTQLDDPPCDALAGPSKPACTPSSTCGLCPEPTLFPPR